MNTLNDNTNIINMKVYNLIDINPPYKTIPFNKKFTSKFIYSIIIVLIKISTDILEYNIELSRLRLTALDKSNKIVERINIIDFLRTLNIFLKKHFELQ